ncbi:MAG: hypothetical protein IKA40_04260 [Clostridia bacterium]|nr:hypothetical protein [Clostridia bacterium]
MTTKTRRKVKLITTFVAMIVTLCMTCFGVLAATSVNYSMNGGITVGVTEKVAATVSGKYAVNGESAASLLFSQPNGGEAQDEAQFTVDGSNEAFSGTITPPTLSTSSLTDYYTFTFYVTNDLTTDTLKVKLTSTLNNRAHLDYQDVDESVKAISYKVYETGEEDTVAVQNITLVDGSISQTTGDIVVPQGQTVEMTVRFGLVDSVANKESGFTANYSFGLIIQR